jgi:hypothetical protein
MQLVTQQATLRLKRQPSAAKVEPLQPAHRVTLGRCRGGDDEVTRRRGFRGLNLFWAAASLLDVLNLKGFQLVKYDIWCWYGRSTRRRSKWVITIFFGDDPPVNRNSFFKVKRPVNLELPTMHIKTHPAAGEQRNVACCSTRRARTCSSAGREPRENGQTCTSSPPERRVFEARQQMRRLLQMLPPLLLLMNPY